MRTVPLEALPASLQPLLQPHSHYRTPPPAGCFVQQGHEATMAKVVAKGTPIYTLGSPEANAILAAFQKAEQDALLDSSSSAAPPAKAQHAEDGPLTEAQHAEDGPRVRPAECEPLNFTSWPPPEGTLFFFHDTTGGVGHIKRMGADLAATCCAVRLTDAVPLTSFNAMVQHYADLVRRAAPSGPLRLGGYSFGARTAFHVAAHLQRVCGRAIDALVCVEDPPSFDLAYIQSPQLQRARAMAANLFKPATRGRQRLAQALLGAAPLREDIQRRVLPLVKAEPAADRSFLLAALLAGRAGGLGEEVLVATLRILVAMSQDAFWTGFAQPSPKVGTGRGTLALPLGRVLLCRSTEEHRSDFNSASEHTLAALARDYGTSASVCTPVLSVVELAYAHQDMFGGPCAKEIARAIDALFDEVY